MVHVVGAGISGCLSAYYLAKKNIPATVYDQSAIAGGLIHSKINPNGLIETAANGILFDSGFDEIFDSLQISLAPKGKWSRRYIFLDGQARRWPLGFSDSFRLIQGFLKFKINKRVLYPLEHESVFDWISKHFGEGVYKNLVCPALAGIYAGDPSEMRAELVFGFLFKDRKSKRRPKGTVAPVDGMGELISGLVDYAKNRGVLFKLGSPLTQLPDTEPVILATNVKSAAQLLNPVTPQLANAMSNVNMVSLVTVTAFFNPSIDDPRGFGCLFVPEEKMNCLGVLWNSDIFLNRSSVRSETWILGGKKFPEAVLASDEQILNWILEDRKRLQKSSIQPIDVSITRWENALPHYDAKLGEVRAHFSKLPNLVNLVGNYVNGIGISRIRELSESVVDKIASAVKL